jgi:hypothetical protein
MNRKKWIWIAVGLLAAALLACGGLVGTVAYFSLRHLNVQRVSAEAADREFEQVRTRFAGKTPLIEIDEDNWDRPRIQQPPEAGAVSTPLHTMHIMAWNERDAKLVKMDLPFWILKLNTRQNSYVFSTDDFGDLERLNLNSEDLERYGPGLLLDHRDRRGVRVLVWTD